MWQKIETAPRDGTEVLVYIRPKVIRLGWYFAPSSRTRGWRDENGKQIIPTYWMPLPVPPEIDTQQHFLLDAPGWCDKRGYQQTEITR